MTAPTAVVVEALVDGCPLVGDYQIDITAEYKGALEYTLLGRTKTCPAYAAQFELAGVTYRFDAMEMAAALTAACAKAREAHRNATAEPIPA